MFAFGGRRMIRMFRKIQGFKGFRESAAGAMLTLICRFGNFALTLWERIFLTMKIKHILLAAALAMGSLTASALTASEAFIAAPRSVITLLDKNERMDMVDYFNAGVARPDSKAKDGTSVVAAMTDETITVKMSDASTLEISVLPASQPIVMVITTVKTPAADSSIAFYSANWKPLPAKGIFAMPQLDDWLSDKSGRDEVTMIVPFMVASATYNAATGELVLTNNLATFLSEAVYKDIAKYMKPSLTYKWNRKSFTR